MSDGKGDFADVLAEAQAMGLAEADPTYDVDGIDSLHKLVILVAMAFGKRIDPQRRARRRNSSHRRGRHRLRARVRLHDQVARRRPLHGRRWIEARVHPSMVPNTHLLSQVSGPFNAICLRGRALGTSIYYGQGAGMMPTATAVVADILDAARCASHLGRRQRAALRRRRRASLGAGRVIPMDRISHEHYIRFQLADRPGVLAKISSILAKEGISIATVSQHERAQRGVIPVVMRTHLARESSLRRALVANHQARRRACESGGDSRRGAARRGGASDELAGSHRALS